MMVWKPVLWHNVAFKEYFVHFQGADYIIALTHMRWPNDTRLAKEAKDIDLFLAGHDHDYGVKKVNQSSVLCVDRTEDKFD